jgi:hypothetical protein
MDFTRSDELLVRSSQVCEWLGPPAFSWAEASQASTVQPDVDLARNIVLFVLVRSGCTEHPLLLTSTWAYSWGRPSGRKGGAANGRDFGLYDADNPRLGSSDSCRFSKEALCRLHPSQARSQNNWSSGMGRDMVLVSDIVSCHCQTRTRRRG